MHATGVRHHGYRAFVFIFLSVCPPVSIHSSITTVGNLVNTHLADADPSRPQAH